ncbi:unnamed protein product [Rotaria magnacalcarata]|nr:unnamed protein product [Rotaria magnacalcarata]
MMASNVLCLFYDGEIFYVLSSKGYISQVYKSSDDLTDYKKLTTLNINELFHNIKIYECTKIPDDDWKTLIQYGKIGNKLHELTTYISHMKNECIQINKEKLKLNFDFKYSKQHDNIISNIVKLKLNEIDNVNELNQLHQQLHNISDQAKIEEIHYLQYINLNLHKTHQYWNNI